MERKLIIELEKKLKALEAAQQTTTITLFTTCIKELGQQLDIKTITMNTFSKSTIVIFLLSISFASIAVRKETIIMLKEQMLQNFEISILQV